MPILSSADLNARIYFFKGFGCDKNVRRIIINQKYIGIIQLHQI